MMALLCQCYYHLPPQELLNQMMDFHESWYEDHAIRGHPPPLYFLKISLCKQYHYICCANF